ncbi:MAG: DUF4145 domain-containing protein [Prevotella sp.]|nr:DUF4145 domain-containing protein [Prevotella sp.]MBO5155781.1 DUF4145 domain-containing protein [Prevotella sp.]
MSNKYIAPNNELRSFTCPHCGTIAQMKFEQHAFQDDWSGYSEHPHCNNVLYIARCESCGKKIIWIDGKYVYPEIVAAEPNADMPDSVKLLYNEAALIYNKSPRAACALLRLAVERLCNELGEKGNIDTMIGNLVKKGLSSIVQKALDAVRVIGNKAVHPGQIAFDVDDKSTAETLMKLLNIITERLITEPKEIDTIFSALPQSAKESIEKRDKLC